MNPKDLILNAIDPAMALLPPQMDTVAARTLLLAIAYQESALKHRRQINGPATGYWQFEQGGGVRGVLTHPASKPHIQKALVALDYAPDATPAECYAAIEHNDILATVFARLLLWTDPLPLPDGEGGGLNLYLKTWRPGKPHPGKWPENYRRAKDAMV